MGNFANRKSHAVFIPYPAQGHINPLFKLAKLIHLRGSHVTYVNTEYNHKRLLKSRGPTALDGFTDFSFETIPDGLTPLEGDGDVSQLPSLCQSIRKNFLKPFCELINRLNHSANVPPVTCLISDCCMSFTMQAAEEFSLPILLYFSSSACSLLNVMHFRSFVERGITPFKDERHLTNGYLETKVEWIPGSNLWKEDTECLEWLESNEPGSVVYVNFGSIIVMTPDQLLEFAWGLADCKKPFLWITRPDLVIGGSVVLSSEFMKEISDRGLISNWCPQEKVLNHPSIGGFLTHCGWNSTTESICAGVPMLCWPFFADQPTNCRFICNEWKIGMEIDTNVKREGLEKLINELMVGENGKKMRQKAMELKKKAEENTRPGGCSYMNLDKVIKEVLLKQN
ncbi:UDP-glucosyltransferase family protein [Medicago truncatula]|uniref:UDP-glucosyltransferase family protein n=1 Tax=Medicago truncatula TaxID=3880 RepID=A0A072TKB3_MEDTR|nr:UDP-glucosyltransferase family protein [Medicago truncatula]